MKETIRAILTAIEEERTLYLLEGRVKPMIMPLHVVKLGDNNNQKLILQGELGDLAISLPTDDATIARYVRFNKLFLSEDDARNHFDLIIDTVSDNIKNMTKKELLEDFFKDWMSEGVNENVKKTMIEKIKTEFGVEVSTD